uniref:Ig-like domain-containing protein n=1 Tax=Cyprinus carpio TaxID=7962 RepID=A0A8C2C905_CYPCA
MFAIFFVMLPGKFSKACSLMQINQSPPDVIERQGETAKIQCLHSVPSYNQINWYRQNQDHRFTLMGYLLGKDPYKENDFKDKIEMSGDGNSNGYLNIKDAKNSVNLTISELTLKESAVYFCAASTHSALGPTMSPTKSPFLLCIFY